MSLMSDKKDTNSTTKVNPFMVRESLGSVEAMRAYDNYLKEHKRRLRQLEKLAAGELTPSDAWYDE